MEIVKLREQHGKKIHDIEREHLNYVNQMRAKTEAKISKIRAEADAKMAERADVHDREIAEARRQVESLRAKTVSDSKRRDGDIQSIMLKSSSKIAQLEVKSTRIARKAEADEEAQGTAR